jgi:hypothetical protein
MKSHKDGNSLEIVCGGLFIVVLVVAISMAWVIN